MKTIEVSEDAFELINELKTEEYHMIKSYLCDAMAVLSDTINGAILSKEDAISCLNELSNYSNMINKFR